MDIAWAAVLAKEAKDGKHWTLGLAQQGVPGYIPIKETGDPADPFYVAKGPTRFATHDEAKDEAATRNERELGLSVKDAWKIVLSSMGAEARETRR